MTNEQSSSVLVIDQNNIVVDTIAVGTFPSGVAFNAGNSNMYVASSGSNLVFVIGDTSPQFEGIIGSGNNINIQVQENSGNNAGGQSGSGDNNSDSPIHQGQSTEQNSHVVS